MPHGTAKKRTEPYTKIIDELPTIRREIVNLVNQSIEEKRQAYVLVDNRSEVNAPLTFRPLQRDYKLIHEDVQASHVQSPCLPTLGTRVGAKYRVSQPACAAGSLSQTGKTCVSIRH